MAKAKKSTKKFVKKHLGKELKKRKTIKAIKQQRAKPLSKSTADAKSSESSVHKSSQLGTSKKRLEDLSVDEFLEGEFSDDIELGREDRKGLVDLNDEEEEEEEENERDGIDLLNQVDDDEDDGEQDFVDITTPGFEEEEEEEDDDEGTEDSIFAQNKKMKSEIGKHKLELEALKQKDPEFYKFLEEHDKDLLNFSEEEEEEEEEEFDDEDMVEGEEGSKVEKKPKSSKQLITSNEDETSEKNKSKERQTLTSSIIDDWCKKLKENPSLRYTKYMLAAFQSSCHYGESDEKSSNSLFNIYNSHVFSRIMMFTLREINDIFHQLLSIDEPSSNSLAKNKKDGKKKEKIKDDSQSLTSNPKWNRVKLLVKLYFKNCVHVLTQMTDASMIAFVLKRMKESIPFFVNLLPLMKKWMKILFHLWGEGEGIVPVIVIMIIRELCIKYPESWLESCLKSIYKTYAMNVKFMSGNSQAKIAFLGASVVEIYGLDPGKSYMQAYVFIRQLALVLRNALTKTTKESNAKVYNWQYINCLEVWTRVLATHCPPFPSPSELQPLIYPLVQIILGTARLLPSAQYTPLHLHCVRLLNHLSSTTGFYIPISPILLEMLQLKEFKQSPISSRERPYNLRGILKVSKDSLRSKVYQEDCMEEIFCEFASHFSHFAFNISFPEFAVFPLLHLRKFMKQTKVEKFKKMAKQLIDQVEKNVDYITKKRTKVDFSPKDIEQVQIFLKEEKQSGNNSLVNYARSLLEKSKQKHENLGSDKVLLKNDMSDEDGEEVEDEKANGSDLKERQKKLGNKGTQKGDESEEVNEETFRTWAPEKKKNEKKKKRKEKKDVEMEDVVEKTEEDAGDMLEDLVLSDDEDHGGSEEDW